MLQAQPFDRRIGLVGAVVREGQTDGPDQREDVDRQQEQDRRRDEEPRDRAVGQRPHIPGHGRGGQCGRPLHQSAGGMRLQHVACSSAFRRRWAPPANGGGGAQPQTS